MLLATWHLVYADCKRPCLQLDSLEPQQNRAHVVTSDGGRVTVALKTATFDSSYVEFEGIVDAPNQLREEARCEFGSSFGELPRAAPVITFVQSGAGTECGSDAGKNSMHSVRMHSMHQTRTGTYNQKNLDDLGFCIPCQCFAQWSGPQHTFTWCTGRAIQQTQSLLTHVCRASQCRTCAPDLADHG